MAGNRSALFLMRLPYLVSGLYPCRWEVRKLITGTCMGCPPTHTHADTPNATPPPRHACTNGHSAGVDIAHTFNGATRTHTRTLGHLHSHIIEPIKEMSLISRGVLALVNHWGFLAGAGDMQSFPSSL